MKLETYKETYYKPIRQIDVPKELQNQPFEVFFVPIIHEVSSGEISTKTVHNTPNPLLKGTVTIIDDITPLDNDWELD